MSVEIRALAVSYEDRRVLHDINLEVAGGSFISIIGKSGCGKSTLLHAIAGFIPSQGQLNVPNRIGIVFQNYALFPWLTIRENIAAGLSGIDRKTRYRIVNEYLEITGLTTEARKYPFQISGGQGQRVALARALAPGPSLILMDEPFGALDLFTRDKMQLWLLDIWKTSQTTILFITHSIEEALFLSDRIVVLAEGRIIHSLNVPFERPRSEEVKYRGEFVALKKHLMEIMR